MKLSTCFLTGRLALAVSIATVTPSYATSVVSGGSLLSNSNADQLASWFGASGLNLSNIYTFRPGDTTMTWHSAADNQGPTFTLITARVANSTGPYQLIGGYNPQSWQSLGGQVVTRNANERTAFIFDLSTLVLQRQITANTDGQFQTYNDLSYGPSFGWGFDIGFRANSLNLGFLNQFSFGGGSTGTANLFGSLTSTAIEIGSIETYTFTSVPEIPSMVGTAFGLSVLVWLRRKTVSKKLLPLRA